MTDQEFEEFCEDLQQQETRTHSNADWVCVSSLREHLNKMMLKIRTEAYDKGYQAGANQMSNDPCLCGFWGKKCSSE